MASVIKQEKRTDNELEREGFKQYPRKKEIIMARELPANEAPKEIKTNWGETLIARAGYIICYDTTEKFCPNPDDYDHWPVEPTIFKETYKAWDEAFDPTDAQKQLQKIGCKPYYKSVGIWAKSLDVGVYIQGLEHEKPVLVPENRVLAIGAEGEPYHMGDETFHDRYDGALRERPKPFKRMLTRLINFFKNE